jgi:glucose/arabinose dehydrogenase
MDQDGIGPALAGITNEVSADWLKSFIKDAKSVIESGDARAVALHDKYKSIMPSFSYYKEDEIEGLVAYLNTHQAAPIRAVAARNEKVLENPIAESIMMSNLVIELKQIAQLPATSEQRPLTRVTKYFSRPDTKEFFVLDLRGKLYRLTNGKAEDYLNIGEHMPNFINAPGHATGFGSFAFHPEFAKNGLLYTTHTEKAGSAPADFVYDDTLSVKLQWVLSEWKTDNPNGFPFKGTHRELFRVNMVGQSHGVQEITFNPLSKPGDEDYGLLYIGIGDGGSAERGIIHINIGPENIWSSIVRIDPMGRNSKNGKYGIPKTNPFANSNNPRALGEVYAYGFRNPHKITWTRSGKMLSSNIGQHMIEELNLILPGHNYGWPFREGSFVIYLRESTRKLYALPPDDEANNYDYPIAEYDHDEGNAIIGGYEYWGNSIPALKGKYIFGDMVNGRLFYVNVADIKEGEKAPFQELRISLNGKITSFKELCNDERLSVRFGRDHEGEIYLSAMPDGKLYKIVSARTE